MGVPQGIRNSMPPDDAERQPHPAQAENANREPGAAGPAGPWRATTLQLLLTLGALAALVWALQPDRPNLRPAPLRNSEAVCPPFVGLFTPTNLTELPGLELASLSPKLRNHVLLRLNLEPCPCGCNTSLAYCLVHHPRCGKCRELAQEIIAEEREREAPVRPGK